MTIDGSAETSTSLGFMGGAGDDRISLYDTVPVPGILLGGDGSDRLFAGIGSLLVGGRGADQLTGYSRDDILVVSSRVAYEIAQPHGLLTPVARLITPAALLFVLGWWSVPLPVTTVPPGRAGHVLPRRSTEVLADLLPLVAHRAPVRLRGVHLDRGTGAAPRRAAAAVRVPRRPQVLGAAT